MTATVTFRKSSNIRTASLLLALACSAALTASPAAAFSLNPIKAVKSAAKTVGNAASSAAKTVKKAATTTAKAVGTGAKAVSKVVSTGAKAAAKTTTTAAKVVVKAAPKVIDKTGNAVSQVYRGAAKVSEKVPVLNAAAPLARDFSRAVKSKAGKIGGAAGAVVAIAGGGIGHAALTAGGWAYTSYHGKKTYDANKTKINEKLKEVRRTVRDLRNNFKSGSRKFKSSLRKTARTARR